jgi:hypothetical protein
VVEDASRGSAAHALGDGIGRVASAPVVLAGTIALVSLYRLPQDVRHATGALLLWAFLSGGVLDRYARRRPTRARGFFAAAGAHFGAMLRLGLSLIVVMLAFHLVIGGDFPSHYLHEAAFVTALAMTMLLTLAQVRVAVEDRRSALGALAGGGRFAVRNPAAIGLYVLFVLAALAVMLAFERAVPSTLTGWDGWLAAQALIAIECFLLLAWLATATSLFQSRLAHAGYTAAPPPSWPDSPAAEAITNTFPTSAR